MPKFTVHVSRFHNFIDQVWIHDIYTAHFAGATITHKKQVHKKSVALPIDKKYRLIQVTIILEDGTKHTKKLML